MKRTDAIGTVTEECSRRRLASHRLAGRLGLCLALALLVSPVAHGKLNDTDRLFSYNLSYLRSDNAVTILRELKYEVVELTGDDSSTLAASFKAYPFDTQTKRPVVISLADSEALNFDPTKIKQDKVTTGGPQQRLLIVWDEARPWELERLLGLLHGKLDVPAKQIVIEALVIELDRDHFRDLGVSYTASKDGNRASFLESGDAGLPFIYQFTRPSVKTIFEFTARVRALVEGGEAEVLSQPSIMVLDGRQAKIDVSDKIPYSREISSTLDVESSVLYDTQYVDAGIVLDLRPRASEDNSEIILKIVATINTQAGASTTKANGGLNAPPLVTREVRTSVRVANNTPFVIGGLIRSTRDVGKSGIPVLSKIPGVGSLFRRKSKNETQKEVIVVVTPHVIPPEDRSFGVALAKDSELFDHFDLSLFQNVYRVRSDDIFDLAFIRDSEFMRELDRWAVAQGSSAYSALKDQMGLPPIAEGDRASLARQLRKIETRQPNLVSDALIRIVERRVPGEDKLVKRMLLEIIEKRRFDRHVSTGSILFFEKLSDDLQDPSQPILDTAPLEPRLRDMDKSSCQTAVLSFKQRPTSQGLPFDPPTASVTREDLQSDESFEARLRQLNVLDQGGRRWKELGVLLNDCYKTRDRSTLNHLKSVMVLKRILDLNPTLPLTLEGFRAGREVIFPAKEELESTRHILDREAAALFYETLDYYYAFEQSIREVLKGLPSVADLALEPHSAPRRVVPGGDRRIEPTVAAPAALAAAGSVAPPREQEPARQPRVRIVVRYDSGARPQLVEGAAKLAWATRVALPPPGSAE